MVKRREAMRNDTGRLLISTREKLNKINNSDPPFGPTISPPVWRVFDHIRTVSTFPLEAPSRQRLAETQALGPEASIFLAQQSCSPVVLR